VDGAVKVNAPRTGLHLRDAACPKSGALHALCWLGAHIGEIVISFVNGLSASTTNMTNACRSVDPLLTACIA
jgi:hypothetical protein